MENTQLDDAIYEIVKHTQSTFLVYLAWLITRVSEATILTSGSILNYTDYI